MNPVYVKKSNPEEWTTWMDRFIGPEPKGGVRVVVEMVQRDTRAKAVFDAILKTSVEAFVGEVETRV